MSEIPALKPLVWVGSSRKDFRAFPDVVKSHMGYALFLAQSGTRYRNAKTLKGYGGADVVEVLADARGDTFRTVYSVRFSDAIYVLHVFQKKSKSGRAIPKSEIDLIKRRLREAEGLSRGTPP